ncbi:MAG: hypothetical protein ACLUHA_06095 [Bacteroides stercoris]
MKYPQRIKVMNTYLVELISDPDEQVSIYVDAYDESEAEAIGVTMLENGERLTVPGRFVQQQQLYWCKQ